MARSVVFLAPDVWGTNGGIARHARIVARCLASNGDALTVLALHDARTAPGDSHGAGIPVQGFAGSRMRFALAACLLARTRPSLVLVEHPNFSALGWLVARLAGARLAVFAHGTDIWAPLGALRRRALVAADAVICVSRFTAERAISANRIARSRVHVLHHCLDPDLQVETGVEHRDGGPSLLTVARIDEHERYKGHEQVIRTLPALLARFPELVYHVVGDGTGRPALERLTRELQVQPAVHFHGTVSEEELKTRYATAAVFVMPSRGEGFGLVFLEAMAHGIPVVAGNADAAVEVVEDGVTGLLVDPGDLGDLTNALTQLLSDGALRARMGVAARRRICECFSFDVYRRTLNSVLDRIVAGDRAS